MPGSPLRRLLAIGTIGLVVGAGTPAATAQDTGGPRPPGRAQAIAELVQLDPAIANLALTIRIGTSLAGHQNLGAQSEAKSIDLGFIGDLLSSEGCDGGDPTIPPESLPEPVTASSADPDDATGVSGGLDQLVELTAQADDEPSSASSATLAPLGLPGVVSIAGGRSQASSTADGHVATAVSEIGRVSIADGLVVLEGLRWEAERRLLPEPTTTTDFTVGRLLVGGVPVALPDDDLLVALQQVLDPVLDPLGVVLELPRVREVADGVELTPLTVGVGPGDARDGLLAPILELLQPARSDLAQFLIDLDCGNSTYVTVLDIVLGAVTGAGFTVVDLGGVTVGAQPITLTSFLGGTPLAPQPSTPTIEPSAPPTTGTTTTPATSATVPPPTSATPTPPTTATLPAVDEVAVAPVGASGERGGPLVAVGLVGLLGIAAAVVAEQRRLRRVARQVPM